MQNDRWQDEVKERLANKQHYLDRDLTCSTCKGTGLAPDTAMLEALRIVYDAIPPFVDEDENEIVLSGKDCIAISTAFRQAKGEQHAERRK